MLFQQNLRPEIPPTMPKELASILERCWHADPAKRPEFEQVVAELEKFQDSIGAEKAGCGCVLM